MGLLEQVLGQVMGRLGSGGGHSRGGTAPHAGNVSPLLIAILALVASRTMQGGAGGLGSKLRDLIAGANSLGTARHTGGGLETSGLPGGGGILGGNLPHSPSSGGGFLDSIGSMLDNPHPGQNPRETGGERLAPAGVPPDGPGGGQYDDGLIPEGRGDLVSSGLGGLLERFQQNGRGDTFDSWSERVRTSPYRRTSSAALLGRTRSWNCHAKRV